MQHLFFAYCESSPLHIVLSITIPVACFNLPKPGQPLQPPYSLRIDRFATIRGGVSR